MARRRGRRILAIGVGIAILAASLLLSLPGPAPFPEGGSLTVSAPLLRIPSAACYEDERHRVLLVVSDGHGTEARMNWEPTSDLGPVHWYPGCSYLHRPAGSRALRWFWGLFGVAAREEEVLAAIVLALPPEQLHPGWIIKPTMEVGRIYLAGFRDGGEVGAVPFRVQPDALAEWFRLGTNATPADLTRSTGLVMELRVTREGDRVHYRWGPDPYATWDRSEPRLSWGHASFTPEEVLAKGKGPLVSRLARLIKDRGADDAPKIVYLGAGTGVRSVDYLRAVECAGGSSQVFFVPFDMLWNSWGLPEISGLDAQSVLIEAPDLLRAPGKLVHLNLLDRDDPVTPGRNPDPGSLRERLVGLAPATVAISATLTIPWADCRSYLDVAKAAGAEVYFLTMPSDRSLGISGAFHLARPAGGAELHEVHLVRRSQELVPDSQSPPDRPVRVRAPDDATVQEVLSALIRLRMAGVTGFAFE